jgi:hypothetical protein
MRRNRRTPPPVSTLLGRIPRTTRGPGFLAVERVLPDPQVAIRERVDTLDGTVLGDARRLAQHRDVPVGVLGVTLRKPTAGFRRTLRSFRW